MYKKFIFYFIAMKLIFMIVLIGSLQATEGAFSQSVKINLSLDGARIEQVLDQIEENTDYKFVYNSSIIPRKTVKINVKKTSVADILTQTLEETGLNWKELKNNVIVISKATPQDPIRIGGIVVNKQGEPIPGVSISIKDWKTTAPNVQSSTATDQNGHWSMLVPNESIVLVVRVIGYETREITVAKERRFKIELTEAVNELEGVVVTGLYTRKAESFTGSAITFSQEDLLTVGAQNVVQSLRNLDPAFQITENLMLGSDPNALPNIQLRGQSGLPDLQGEYSSNPNQPLFILDGFETTIQKVIDLDIYRVKSITLLKDAASKAIYGSRAANGVVVIETLRPEPGKLRFTYSMNTNVQLADLSSYNLTNAGEKLQAEVLAGIYSNATAGPGEYALKEWYNQNLALVESGVNTDWLAKPLRNGIGQRHSIRAEGGDASMRYGVDLMYNDVKGAMKGSDRKSLSGALDLTYRTKKLSFNNILTIVDNNANNSPWGEFSTYAAMNPYLPYQDNDGNILKAINTIYQQQGAGGGVAGSLVFNPAYNATLSITDQSQYTDITNNFSAEYSIIPGLLARGRFTVTKQYNGADIFLPADHTLFTGSAYQGDNINRRGRYTKSNGELNNFSGNLLLNYTRVFGKHLVAANGGFDANSFSGFSNAYIVEGFPNDRMDFVSLAMQYMQNSRPTGTESTVRDASALFSTNYTYDDRFLFDFSYRGTQSSQFGRNARWGQFWSTGIGWNLHNEEFIRSLGVIDQLRLRATTGYTGSQNFNSSMSMATYNYYLENPYTTSGNGAFLIGLANPDLKWQRKQDNNFGLDLSVFSRLNFRLDYYISTTDGLITDITLPPSNGFSTFKANLGKAENRGFDARMDVRIFNDDAKRNFLNVFAMLSHNKNTLKEISNGLNEWNSRQDDSWNGQSDTVSTAPRLRFVEGQSMNAIWAVPSLGIDPATGREVYVKRDGSVTYTWDAADQIVAGDALPKYYGNFGFNLQWSGWQLNASFRYQWGGSIYNQTLVDKVENANIYQNVDRRVLSDRWQQPGDISFFKDIADESITRASTRFIEKNDLLSLAALDIRYDIDRLPYIRRWGFSRVRAGVNISELLLASSVRVERGTTYPFAHNLQFSLQFMF